MIRSVTYAGQNSAQLSGRPCGISDGIIMRQLPHYESAEPLDLAKYDKTQRIIPSKFYCTGAHSDIARMHRICYNIHVNDPDAHCI